MIFKSKNKNKKTTTKKTWRLAFAYSTLTVQVLICFHQLPIYPPITKLSERFGTNAYFIIFNKNSEICNIRAKLIYLITFFLSSQSQETEKNAFLQLKHYIQKIYLTLLSTTCVKIHQIPYVIFETISYFSGHSSSALFQLKHYILLTKISHESANFQIFHCSS